MKNREPSLPLKPIGGDPNTPRALLPKGSPEWCYRTIDRLRYALEEIHVTESHYDKVIDELVEYRAWEKIPTPESPYGSLDELLKAELGLSKDEAKRKKVVQQAAINTTGEVLPRGNPTGTNQHGTKKEIGNFPVSTQPVRASQNGVTNRTQRKLDRLARDFPSLHEEVKSGQSSVHGAYIQAGLAKRTVPLPVEPQDAARTILRHFQDEPLLELIRVLANHAGYELRKKE
jgi:hypothetical protein